jgi:dCMP deaminase
VIVGENKNVLSTGFNGFPHGVEEFEVRKLPEYKGFYTAHAEQNAMDLAQSTLKGAFLFTTHHPCASCARSIIQKGIKYVFWCVKPDQERWKDSTNAALFMLEEAGVSISQIESTQELSFVVVEHSTKKNSSSSTLITSECGSKVTLQSSTGGPKVQIRWGIGGLNPEDLEQNDTSQTGTT